MPCGRRAGISMVEVMVTVVIANIGFAALVQSFSHYRKQEIETRAGTTALLAAQTVLEEIRSSDFDTLFTQYNDVPGDDPNGQDRGAYFSIAGLNPPRVAEVPLNHGQIILVREEEPDGRSEPYRSLRCAVRVNYEVLGEPRQVELDSLLTRPLE
jgi:type II secretory pathway pseudopilin PulG